MSDKKRHHHFKTLAQEMSAQKTSADDFLKTIFGDLTPDNQDIILERKYRHIRLMLEFQHADILVRDHNIKSTVAVFGGARILEAKVLQDEINSAEKKIAEAGQDTQELQETLRLLKALKSKWIYYDMARKFANIVSKEKLHGEQLHIVSGGGPGIMEASNRGAEDAGMKSIGMCIILPSQKCSNPYVTKELNFNFHYFCIRKMHLIQKSQAIAVFPGGFGTFDELFEILTLIKTEKMSPLPVILFGKSFWQRVIKFNVLAEEGLISKEDLNIFQFADTAEEGWEAIKAFHK